MPLPLPLYCSGNPSYRRGACTRLQSRAAWACCTRSWRACCSARSFRGCRDADAGATAALYTGVGAAVSCLSRLHTSLGHRPAILVYIGQWLISERRTKTNSPDLEFAILIWRGVVFNFVKSQFWIPSQFLVFNLFLPVCKAGAQPPRPGAGRTKKNLG